jgi:hypothetical protein
MVGSKEPDGFGLGDTLGRDDRYPVRAGDLLGVELRLAVGFEEMVGRVECAKVGAGDPVGIELVPVLGADDKSGERLI